MALVRNSVSGFKLQAANIQGRPDIYFEKEHLAIFVDGCFWHGCKRCGHLPKNNAKFWALKIQRNQERDELTRQGLISMGTHVLRFWEHQLTDDLDNCVARVQRRLESKPRKTLGRR
ncbi:MAG: very short patch repair endonuclease [Acidobacteriaceae bacterium]